MPYGPDPNAHLLSRWTLLRGAACLGLAEEIIAQGTDFRYLAELKRELKEAEPSA